jgi:hypothetical protein
MLTTYAPSSPALPLPLRGRGSRGIALLAVTFLLLTVVSGWLPQVLDHSAATSAPAQQADRPGFDVDAAVSQAAHTPVPTAAGTLEAHDPAYKAVFDRSGFSYQSAAGGVLGLALSHIARGSAALTVDRATWAAQGQAAAREVAPGVHERVTTRAGAVEWDVVLDHQPAGEGVLHVTADLDGVAGAPVRITVDGRPAMRLHLTGGGAVVIDELVVKDAHGSVLYRGMPSFHAGHVSLAVPGSVLAHALYPLTIDPTVSSGRGVNTPGFNPAIAFNGTDYMVVWQEPFGSESDIYGARLNTVGAIVTQRFGISTDSFEETHPDISWNGSQYLVVFERRNQGAASTTDRQYDIYGQRVGSVGGLVGSNFAVRAGALGDRQWNKRHPAVTSDALDWFVVWDDNSNAATQGLDIWGKTISRNGSIGLATPIALTGVDEIQPALAWNGGSYLVAYTRTFNSSDHDIIGQRVSPFTGFTLDDGTKNGEAIGGAISIQTSSKDQMDPTVASEGYNQLPCDSCTNPASRGTNFYVAYGDFRAGNWDVFGARVTATGSTLDTAGIAVAKTSLAEFPNHHGATFNGAYFVAFIKSGTDTNPGGIYASRVDKNGKALDVPALTIQDTNQTEEEPAVSPGDNKGWAVAYVGCAPGNTCGAVMRHVAPK